MGKEKKMKRIISVFLFIVCFMGMIPAGHAEEAPPKVTAIYCAVQRQIVTNAEGEKELADTIIYLFDDGTYRQYFVHNGTMEIYSIGEVIKNGNPEDLSDPVIVTFHAQKMWKNQDEYMDVDMSYDVNLSEKGEFCLYPVGSEEGLVLDSVFMQAEKQKLVLKDGAERYLSTIWLYYDNGSFQQYALMPEAREKLLFSTGDYVINGDFATPKSVLTLHRTQKYADGIGLSEYDSLHDYSIGELGFIRVYPLT